MALLHVMQFAAQNVATVNPVFTTIWTVPAGKRDVLRSIAVRNLSGAAGVTWYVRLNGVVIFTNVLGTGGTSAGSTSWRPWIVMTPGQLLEVAVSAAPGIGLVASGSEYFI